MQGALKKIFQILKVNKKGVVNTIQDFVNNLKVRNTCNFQVVHKKKKKKNLPSSTGSTLVESGEGCSGVIQ